MDGCAAFPTILKAHCLTRTDIYCLQRKNLSGSGFLLQFTAVLSSVNINLYWHKGAALWIWFSFSTSELQKKFSIFKNVSFSLLQFQGKLCCHSYFHVSTQTQFWWFIFPMMLHNRGFRVNQDQSGPLVRRWVCSLLVKYHNGLPFFSDSSY